MFNLSYAHFANAYRRYASRDAQTLAALARSHPQARRYVFGHSLGGAIAVQLAAQAPDAAGLIGQLFASLFAFEIVSSDPDFLDAQWDALIASALNRDATLSAQPAPAIR